MACSIGSVITTILGYTVSTGKKSEKSFYYRHPWFSGPCNRMKAASLTLLSKFFDSALFFSLMVQIAGVMWATNIKHHGHPTTFTDDILGSIEQGGYLYSIIMLFYTSIVSILPLSILVATPFFWRRIRRHNFRFHAMIVILVLSGIIIFLRTQHYLDLYREDIGHNSGCATEFTFEILPPRTEMKILQCSWTLCACTLVCVRWPTGIRNKLRSSDIIKNILHRLGLRYVGVLLLLLETRSLVPISPINHDKAHYWLSALDRCISSLMESRRKAGPATALSGISSSICYLTTGRS